MSDARFGLPGRSPHVRAAPVGRLVTAPRSLEWPPPSGGGMHSTATRRKEITVTVHARFALD